MITKLTTHVGENAGYNSFGCVSLIFLFVVNAYCQAGELGWQGDRLMRAEDTPIKSDAGQQCTARFATFVQELDRLLASDPPTVLPVQDLFGKYLPVENCNINELLEIARASRFFDSISDQRTYYVIALNSRGLSSRPGFAVQVSLVKSTGASRLPFVKVNGF